VAERTGMHRQEVAGQRGQVDDGHQQGHGRQSVLAQDLQGTAELIHRDGDSDA
jgi:hypothetical protein